MVKAASPGSLAAVSPSPAERLAGLRGELARRGVDGFLVPRGDEHQGEYVPAAAERLAWLTGFKGSAGFACVLLDEAAIFVDGRYTLQVGREVDVSIFTPRHVTDEPLAAWLEERLKPGQRLAYDPWPHTEEQVRRLERPVTALGASLAALDGNPIDAVWTDRPAPPQIGRPHV